MDYESARTDRGSCGSICRNTLSHRVLLESHSNWRIRFGCMRTRIWSALAIGGSFAIAIVAIAVVLGAPSRDQWLEWWQDARRAFSVWLPRY
jgi:hypothetical protein